MPHALDFHNFRITEKLIHHAIIANANSVRTLRAAQFLRSTIGKGADSAVAALNRDNFRERDAHAITLDLEQRL